MHTRRWSRQHKAQNSYRGVLLPGTGTGAAILASMSLSRVVMRRSSLEFNMLMDLRMMSLSATSGVLSLFASFTRISAVMASISPFKSASCFSVLIALSEDAEGDPLSGLTTPAREPLALPKGGKVGDQRRLT